MSLYKFTILLWKNYRLRKYHWISTILEILIPMLLIPMLVYLLPNATNTSDPDPVILGNPILGRYFLETAENIPLLYSPSNPATDKFMNQLRNHSSVKIKGLPDEKVLEQEVISFVSAVDPKGIDSFFSSKIPPVGIHFRDIKYNDTFPNKLSYVLMEVNIPNTNKRYEKSSFDFEDVSSRLSGYIAVQLLLNQKFIQFKTNKNISFSELLIEKFPKRGYNYGKMEYYFLIKYFIIIMSLILSYTLIKDIIDERETGMKELMKMSGLSELAIWLGWFVHASIVCIISFTAVIIVILLKTAYNYFPFHLMWLFGIFYLFATISLCFVFSSIFHNATIASSFFLICILLMMFGTPYLIDNIPHMLICLYPIGCLTLGFEELRHFDKLGLNHTLSTIMTTQIPDGSVSVFSALGMLLFDMLLYIFLAYYISCINPGKFGVRVSPLFLFERFLFWRRAQMPPIIELDVNVDSKYFETPPTNLTATIQIRDLHKRYSSVYAVNGVNLDIYEGELTALLGHNGAGKTTLMSMMTGLTEPTSGTILYDEMDVFGNMDLFRQKVGMCPQENRTFPYLSVMDHMLFFGMLKGISHADAVEEAYEYLWMMNMASKTHSRVKDLSGGMKRKLCFGVALMAHAEVLILDEPTSGMDAESRRGLWDLILQIRGKRTVIFTTHYMEEADVLGDRIAIMNQGIVVCHGSPMFLKNAYDTGYQLTITTHNENTNTITQRITQALPGATMESEKSSELTYQLPLNQTDKFPSMFKDLEQQQSRLGIEHIAVSATTMEHVFLKAGGVSTVVLPSTSTSAHTEGSLRGVDPTPHHVTGLLLFFQQIFTIIKKKSIYTRRDLSAILAKAVLPILVLLYLISTLEKTDPPSPSLDLSMAAYPKSKVMIQKNNTDADFIKYLREYVNEKKGVVVETNESSIFGGLSEIFWNYPAEYGKHYISAFSFNRTLPQSFMSLDLHVHEKNTKKTSLLFQPEMTFSLPITITTYSNAILRNITKTNDFQIETIVHPIGTKRSIFDDDDGCGKRHSSMFSVLWYLALAYFTADLSTYFMSFVSAERFEGFYHVQMMSRISPFVYWLGTLMYDLVFFLVIVILRIIIFKLVDNTNLLSLNNGLGLFILIVTLYGISGLLMIYIFSCFTGSKEGSTRFFILMNVLSPIYGLLEWSVMSADSFFKFTVHYIINASILLLPMCNFGVMVVRMLNTTIHNSYCMDCYEEFKNNCETRLVIYPYMKFASKGSPNGLLFGVILLAVQSVVLFIILWLLNIGYLGRLCERVKSYVHGTESTNPDIGDSDVQLELKHVRDYVEDETNLNQVSLVVDGLRKNYIRWLTSFSAVSDVSFVVEHSQCFGLLGINGAGKTTTFKMLTTEIVPTVGDSFIEGDSMRSNTTKYLSNAGYCPQTNCFIERLTGREMLKITAALRGVTRRDNDEVVNKWISIIGLEKFENRRCSDYSGGNKRKLCAAMALIGDPRVVFLDEPTSGVDPVSRRNLYNIMAQTRSKGQAVILTSHSMEECEALCDRLTIMVKGAMKCIGTTRHLKKRYAQGFSVMFKIHDTPDSGTQIANLKHHFDEIFNPKYTTLKDEHLGTLYYQINNTALVWSALFENMERIKAEFPNLIEDYVLTDTTLEEVFLAFAKEDSALKK